MYLFPRQTFYCFQTKCKCITSRQKCENFRTFVDLWYVNISEYLFMSVISFILFGFFSRSWYLFESAELGHCCCCNGNIFFTILTELMLFNCCFIKRSYNTLISQFLIQCTEYQVNMIFVKITVQN